MGEVARRRSAERRSDELTTKLSDLSRQIAQLQNAPSVLVPDTATNPLGIPAVPSASSAAPALSTAAPDPVTEAEVKRLRLQVESMTRQKETMERETSQLHKRLDAMQK